MKILQVALSYPPAVGMGGAQRIMSDLACAAAQIEGVSVRVLTTNFGGFRSVDTPAPELPSGVETRDDGVIVNRIPVKGATDLRRLLSVHELRRIRSEVASADVIHLGELRTLLNAATAYWCYRLQKPMAISPWGGAAQARGLRSMRRYCFDRSVGYGLYRNCDLFVAQTGSEANAIRRLPGVHSRICEIPLSIPNGMIAAGKSAGAERRLSSTLEVLCVARLSPLKGIDRLIHAFSRLPGDPKSNLTIVGNDCGARRDLEQLIRRLDVSDRVRLVGSMDHPHLASEYLRCDVCALTPVYDESTSLATIEAAAFGCVPLVNQFADLPFLQSEYAGWRASSSIDSIEAVLRSALIAKRSGELDRMRQRAMMMIDKHHNLAINGSTYAAELGRLIDK